ncbi:MAG: response regulator [Campylobacterota bacterium]|nr:response regulator [Campylobacterota bacterium]
MKIKNKKLNMISQILIIDDDVVFNNNLNDMFKSFGYYSTQSFDIKESMKLIENYTDELCLIVLAINKQSQECQELFKYIQKNSDSKIIILSDKEYNEQRDKFFKKGILDYHLKTNSIDYIFNDINDSLKRLSQNNREKILIIDDSKVVCYVVKSLLESRNYNVITAYSAREGIEVFKNNDISLLILDMELPDMHGIDVLDTLRDVYYINNFPILILSGSENPSIVRNALKKGASDFLKKPFIYEEFLLKIDLWIKSSKWQKTIKNQKKQIEDSLNSFEALVNSTIEALFIFQKDICVDANDEAVILIGVNDKKEIIGKNIFQIFTNVTDEHKEELKDNKIDHYFEDTVIQRDGTIRDVQVKERNITIREKCLKIIAIVDITDIKQKEKMLNNQSKMAAMGEMIGNIAHQWRQPLTAISVTAGGIKLGYELDINDEEDIIKELDSIVENSQFLSDTIEDFQNFLKNDRITTDFSVKDTIGKSLAIISANLDSHEINIVNHYDKNIIINGIQNDLIQVLLNIINNAADILKGKKDNEHEKYIIIDIEQNKDYIIINIQDSGGGVLEDIKNKIFEPYFTTKHQSQGIGLGLYMTHKIVVENLSGSIVVENCNFDYNDTSYFGAKFTINIPLKQKVLKL